MYINTCTPLIHDLHVPLSFQLEILSPLLFSRAPFQVVSAFVQYLLRALTHAGAGEATWSGSSRHPSTVSNTRFYIVYRWSSSSEILPLRVYLFFMRSGAPTAHDVSYSGALRRNSLCLSSQLRKKFYDIDRASIKNVLSLLLTSDKLRLFQNLEMARNRSFTHMTDLS